MPQNLTFITLVVPMFINHFIYTSEYIMPKSESRLMKVLLFVDVNRKFHVIWQEDNL